MKNEIRLALLCMAAAAVPAFAQNALPDCGSANFDPSHDFFTVVNPAAGAVNQQCLVTVHSSASMPDQSRQFPASNLVEGNYTIALSGGGGGGGGGASRDEDGHAGGSGGGGASALQSQTVQYLTPGVYKLTIGTGGEGGRVDGGRTEDGNPTSVTNANTGQLVAGFQGADLWTQQYQAAGSGRGGVAVAGGNSGASGAASAGGQGGSSGEGSGGTSGSSSRNSAAQAGGDAGHGFIRLARNEPAPQAIAPAIVAQAPASESVSAPARAAVRPARRDRN